LLKNSKPKNNVQQHESITKRSEINEQGENLFQRDKKQTIKVREHEEEATI